MPEDITTDQSYRWTAAPAVWDPERCQLNSRERTSSRLLNMTEWPDLYRWEVLVVFSAVPFQGFEYSDIGSTV